MADETGKILVVDDTEATRYTVMRILRADGHEVLEAGRGADAIALARAARPDLMVLDIRLPDMLGYDVAEQLKGEPGTSSIVIVQLSASFTDPDSKVQGLQRGADAFLTHPIEPQVLSATVRAMLRLRRAEQREREARERAEQLAEELRQEGERKNEFLAMLSHELRNPLMPIRNSLYIMNRADQQSEQGQRARRIIDRQVAHLTRLVDDLLDVTRIARGKLRLQREQLELDGLVRRTVDDYREHFRRGRIELEVRIPGQALFVTGDPTRLAQLVGNLLQNAAKFTPGGGRVAVALEAEAGQAVLSVWDSGAGIAPEVLQRLFQPFVQADKTLDRSRGGLGLGLALAKAVVELHGGTITAHSDGLGHGAEFVVKLPLAERAERQAAAAGDSEPTVAPRRVLIIEDNADAAQSLREALELSAHEVEIALDGPEGLAVARAFQPDVVLCDIGLPSLGGYQVAKRLRADAQLGGVLLIALTGYSLNEDVERALEAGFDHHIAKPPRLDELERIIAAPPAPRAPGGPDR